MNSEEFVHGMQRLDPVWKPWQAVIDEKLISDVCDSIGAW
jgi:hypothetical protein